MSDVIQRAINHIDDEVEKSKNPVAKAIGQYLIDKCLTTDSQAEKVLDNKLSLEKCADFVKNKAKSSAVNGCAMVEDMVVYSWVREYYGLSKSESTPKPKIIKPSFDSPSLLDLM